jgi:adenine phosphoribosyltransferase
VIFDDLLATGGTAAAGSSLVQQMGAEILEVHFIIELSALKGRDKAPKGVKYHSLFQY